MTEIDPHESFYYYKGPEETLLYRFNCVNDALESVKEVASIDRQAMNGELTYDEYVEQRKEAVKQATEDIEKLEMDSNGTV